MAAARHSRYWPATSISFSVVAPKLGSDSGVSSGHAAVTSGLGVGAGKGGIDALQLVRAVAAIDIDRLLTDFTLDLLADGLEVEAHLLEDVHGDSLAELDEPEEEMLGADVVVVEAVRLLA
jgi:hypothetical protein